MHCANINMVLYYFSLFCIFILTYTRDLRICCKCFLSLMKLLYELLSKLYEIRCSLLNFRPQ